MNERAFRNATLRLLQGDITTVTADAIVNAANSTLLGGGGVDGAIHRVGGAEILAECRTIRDRTGGCPTGEAVATTAGKLDARFVIHTVGPVWQGGAHDEDRLLERCYRESMRIAEENDVRTIAFPSLSTGAFGFPIERAAPIALAAVASELIARPLDLATFVLFSEEVLAVYSRALGALEDPA